MAQQYFLIPQEKIGDKNSDRLVRLDDEYLKDSAIEEMFDNENEPVESYSSYEQGFLACARQLREFVS